MSRLDELPPDQRAALSLLLRQHKSYAEVAAMLAIGEAAVRDRAHAGLTSLAPEGPEILTTEQRSEIGDYLLGQLPGESERERARAYLREREPANAWARELAGPLSALSPDGLPEIPPARPVFESPAPPVASAASALAGAAEASQTQMPGPGPTAEGASIPPSGGSPAARLARSQRSSRLGGAVLLVVLVAAVVVAVVLLTGGSSHKSHPPHTATTKASAGTPKLENEIPLTSPDPHSTSIGVIDVVSEASKLAFLIEARNLPEAKGFYYAIWLYNSPTSFLALTKSSDVGSNHTLGGISALPTNAGDYKQILLTRETAAKPTHPGPVVLQGPFSLH